MLKSARLTFTFVKMDNWGQELNALIKISFMRKTFNVHKQNHLTLGENLLRAHRPRSHGALDLDSEAHRHEKPRGP